MQYLTILKGATTLKYKMNFREYKDLQKALAKMSQKDLSRWIESIYGSGYKDGQDYLLGKIKESKGVGPATYKNICRTIGIDSEVSKC